MPDRDPCEDPDDPRTPPLERLLVPCLQGFEIAEVLGGEVPPSLELDLSVSKFAPLAEVGGAVAADAGVRRILLRTSETEIVALDRLCTHRGCDLDPGRAGIWDPAAQELLCRRHRAAYGAEGSALSGPTRGPLARFPVTFELAAGTGSVALR